MKLAIMSDSHESWNNLEKAITLANEQGCDMLLFGGDLMAPGKGTKVLQMFDGPVHTVFGNNDGDMYRIHLLSIGTNITVHGAIYEDTIDDIRIVMNHYPNIMRWAAKAQEYDLCIYGHDHIYYHEKVGNTDLINPGALLGDKEPAGFVVYDTQTKQHEHILL